MAVNFEILYVNYYKMVYHIALRITKDSNLSEDIVQETFIKAYKKIDTLIDEEKAGGWLSSIAARTSIDFIRKEIRAREVLVDPFSVEVDSFLSSTREEVEQAVNVNLLKEELATEIRQLPLAQQEVFLLRVQHGMNEEEIAEKLDLKRSTVKTRFFRARKKLKNLYSLKYSA
ncbi:RNA polymerase sigma factor [Bacillus salacetis]|uniref:RNA polymerase sigma factor n=1 Tax=Bacillus salacetis TaxID=2315464 RepID=A0A3A1R6J1_9BACI|nr:RNA polymerase sigma factor [Bacillus salacetis]RIW38458.1 RNA polymerase sigma factor [Bacillus salacetis]